MTTVYQLRAFAFWMMRKALRLPLTLVKQVSKGLEFVAKAVYEDGAIGVFLAFLISGLGFMLGFMAGGIYLECTKVEDAVVQIGQVAQFGAYGFIATATTVFFYTSWYCFKQEQNELIENLKEKYHE